MQHSARVDITVLCQSVEIAAVDVMSPDLPAKRRSHGCMRNKRPHTDAEAHHIYSRQRAALAGSHSAGVLGWSNIWLPGIQRKDYLLPLMV